MVKCNSRIKRGCPGFVVLGGCSCSDEDDERERLRQHCHSNKSQHLLLCINNCYSSPPAGAGLALDGAAMAPTITGE